MKGGANISWSVLNDMAHPSHRGKESVELLLIRWEIGMERLKQLRHLVREYSTCSEQLECASFG